MEYQKKPSQIHFISYGDNKYENAKTRIKSEAIKFGKFDTINIYSPNDIDNLFVSKYMNILLENRGGGYWIWKEYFIQKKLNEINFGDYLIYCDSGCTVNSDGKARFDEYIKLLDDSETGIISFQMHCVEERYTTSQIFKAICDDITVKKSGQHMATILIMKKCQHVLNIFEEFFRIIDKDNMLITDYYNTKHQLPCFIDNRHDQSILSVILKNMGSIVIPDETYYVNFNCEEAKHIPFLATRKR